MMNNLREVLAANELASALGLELKGDDQKIFAIGSLAESALGVLSFSKEKRDPIIGGVVIGVQGQKAQSLMVSENPRLDFCRALNLISEWNLLEQKNEQSQVDPSCNIASSAIIEPGAVIARDCQIGHNVVVGSRVEIGSNCIIRENSVIGAEGFGFEQTQDGSWIRFPHLGGVKIGSNVEIGALNSICKGALGDTVIGDGVKTDNLVHIAHNCQLGRDCIITACAEFSGGVQLGERVWIGPNSSLMEKINIGDDALVGIGSVVRKNLPAGVIAAGSPAKILRSKSGQNES